MNAAKKLFLLSILVFVQDVFLYSCEESKSADTSEIVDLTPIDFGLAPNCGRVLSVKPYSGVSYWKRVVCADGTKTFSEYRVIGKDSVEFKEREQEIEAFAAISRDHDEKMKYYAHAICTGGMSPSFKANSLGRPASYCFAHHCYDHECLGLYAYQAYLVQPSSFLPLLGVTFKKDEIDKVVAVEGRKEVLRRAAPQSEIHSIKKLHSRQLGLR